jgi:glutathione S-transferase
VLFSLDKGMMEAGHRPEQHVPMRRPRGAFMASDVLLYAFPGSLCSQKVRLALAEKRVAYTKEFIDIELRLQNYEPWYLRMNPKGVVPTLVHGDRVVTDSARIIRYVDETFDGPTLTPSGDVERQRMQSWIDRQDDLRMRELSYASFKGTLGFVLRRVSMPLRARRLSKLRAAHPDLEDVYAAKIQDVRQWSESIASAEEVADARRDLESVLRLAEEQLAKTAHLAGDAYSLADVAWTCILARLKMLGLADTLWGEARLPALAAYYETLRARPSFTDAEIWEAPPSIKARRALMRSALASAREKRRARRGLVRLNTTGRGDT